MKNRLTCAVAMCLASLTAAAATPEVRFDSATVVGVQNQVRSYNVPVISSTGAIKYYDITLDLLPNANGTPPVVADITFALSPKVSTKAIVAGTYKTSDPDAGCKVSNVALPTGRTQSNFDCTGDTGLRLTFSVATGAISANHPYYPQLHTAGVDARADASSYFWGVTTSTQVSSVYVGSCGDYYTNAVVAAQQVGNVVYVTLFRNDAISDCVTTLNKQ